MQPSALEHIQLITDMFYIQVGGFMITFGKQAWISRNRNRVVAKYLDGTGRYEIKEGDKNHPSWHRVL